MRCETEKQDKDRLTGANLATRGTVQLGGHKMRKRENDRVTKKKNDGLILMKSQKRCRRI